MKIIVFGGDGYCGWPLSLGLSDAGHDVTIMDNLHQNNREYTLFNRLMMWRRKTKNVINFKKIDIALNYQALKDTIKKIQPDCVFILTDLISISPQGLNILAFKNNIFSCFNIMSSLIENEMTDCHIYYYLEPLPRWEITKEINYHLLRIFPKRMRILNNVHFLSFCNVWGIDTNLTSSHVALANNPGTFDNNLMIKIITDHFNGKPIDTSLLSFTHIQDFVNRSIEELTNVPSLDIIHLQTETIKTEYLTKIIEKESTKSYRDEKDILISPESIFDLKKLIHDREM